MPYMAKCLVCSRNDKELTLRQSPVFGLDNGQRGFKCRPQIQLSLMVTADGSQCDKGL